MKSLVMSTSKISNVSALKYSMEDWLSCLLSLRGNNSERTTFLLRCLMWVPKVRPSHKLYNNSVRLKVDTEKRFKYQCCPANRGKFRNPIIYFTILTSGNVENILLSESPELILSCQICVRILSCTELQIHLCQFFI